MTPASAKALESERLVLSRPLNLVWTFHARGLNNGFAATSHQDTLYYPPGDKEIVALYNPGGEFKWRSEIGGRITAQPVSDEKGVYVASESLSDSSVEGNHRGVLRLLGGKSGVTTWTRTFPAPVVGILASVDALLAATEDGRIYSVDKLSGDVRWARQNTAPFNSSPVLFGKHIYLGDEAGQVRSFQIETGSPAKSYRTRGPVRGRPSINEPFLYVGSFDRHIYSFELDRGKLKWRVETGAAVQSVVAAGDYVIAVSLDNYAYRISPESGRKLWRRRLPGRVSATPLVTESAAVFAPASGEECVILSLENGKVINSVNVGEGNEITSPPVISSRLLLLPTRRGLFAYSNSGPAEK